MRRQSGKILLAAVLAATVWSCNQSDPAPKGDYVQGVFVLNEGNFSQNNGGLSYLRREDNSAIADVYATVNSTALQGGVQGYALAGEKGIILVDNDKAGQDKVLIVNANTMEYLAAISGADVENPREVVAVSNNKAYISCWGANADYKYTTGYIAVVNLETNAVTKKISIAAGPENMVFSNNKLFVGTVSYGGGKTMHVINTANDELIKTVSFDAAPSPIGVDANGKLWVSAGGNVLKTSTEAYATESKLTITTDASKSVGQFAFSGDKQTVYFVLSWFDANYVSHGETYKFGINDTQINTSTPFVKRVFSGLAVDPAQGLIYAGVTPSYAQAGYALRYRADGTLVDSVKVGIAPTGFVFR